MNKIKTINGSKLLSDKTMELYPYALKFYGNEYKSIIDSTLDKTIFYEWHNESKKEIISKIIGNRISSITFYEKDKIVENESGFHYLDIIPNYGFQHIVAIKTDDYKDTVYADLAHEVYGHAVCSEKYPIITKNGKLFQRNGICIGNLLAPKVYNEQANEGMIEYITSQIVNLYKPEYNRDKYIWSYNEAVEVAKQMFKYIGKEKMLELLTLNKGTIEDLFDSTNPKSWTSLALELEKKHNEIDLDEHLDGFIKRYKCKNR